MDLYGLGDDLEYLPGCLFPKPGDDGKIHEIFRSSARDTRLGIAISREGSRIHYACPVAVLAANRT